MFARAPPVVRGISNEALGEVIQNPKMGEKWKKSGIEENRGKKEKGKQGCAGRPDAVRASGEISIFENTR